MLTLTLCRLQAHGPEASDYHVTGAINQSFTWPGNSILWYTQPVITEQHVQTETDRETHKQTNTHTHTHTQTGEEI